MKKHLFPALVASLIVFGLPASGSAQTRAAVPQLAQAHSHPVSNAAPEGAGPGAGAGPMSGMRMHGGAAMMGERGWLHGLGLSEAQNDQVFEIMHAQAPKMRAQSKAVRAARAELDALSTAPNLDAAQLRAASDKLARALADMSESRVRTRQQIFQVLTPEQRQVVAARIAERHQQGGPAGGMRHDGRSRGPGQPGQPGAAPVAPTPQRS